MAVRPLFLPFVEAPFWKSKDISFHWFAGLSAAQKRKSVRSLHDAALDMTGASRILEVSSKSELELGVRLSAFNLKVHHPTVGVIPFEAAFQGSKTFLHRGQLGEAYGSAPREAKALAQSIDRNDELVGFTWSGELWPLEPKSWFYDWLYISAILESYVEATQLLRLYDGFTDIEFNPAKSFNCQARSCAIIASTRNDSQLRKFISNPVLMICNANDQSKKQEVQRTLF